MKTKKTLRMELIWALLESVGLAFACMLILCVFMILGSVYMPFAIFFNQHLFFFILLFILIFSSLTILFFLMFIRKKVQYIEEITRSLDTISAGSLDIKIPVRTNDELGIMAETVNDMASRLKSSLEERNRQEQNKNNLITNISHDLRTPLTSILGYLELIGSKMYGDEANLDRYAAIALSQCRDLKTRIDMLFEFTKLSNPDLRLNKMKISLGVLIEQVITGYIPVLREAGMECRMAFSNEKLFVDVDPILFSRVIDNLISNAVKYGKDGKLLDVRLVLEGDEAVIRFTNYGKSISEDDLPYIFDRYYRSEQSKNSGVTGTGLGLAIVKSIVELHGGSIRVESKDNMTTFEVKLKSTH